MALNWRVCEYWILQGDKGKNNRKKRKIEHTRRDHEKEKRGQHVNRSQSEGPKVIKWCKSKRVRRRWTGQSGDKVFPAQIFLFLFYFFYLFIHFYFSCKNIIFSLSSSLSLPSFSLLFEVYIIVVRCWSSTSLQKGGPISLLVS